MNEARLEKLLAFLKEDPEDPFTLYAIATEYADTQPEKALGYFEKLLREHENYTGTYYHAARLYEALGRDEDAQTTFEKGIKVCEAQEDHHALRELKSAYEEFMEEG